MRLFPRMFAGMLLTLLLSALPLALGEQLVIPQVQAAVNQQLQEFKQYTAYNGPTGTALSAALVPTPKPLIQVLSKQAAVAAATAAPYWYESISHQGIAAFNTNTTYKVYRNVKSYGAKGYVCCLANPSSRGRELSQSTAQ